MTDPLYVSALGVFFFIVLGFVLLKWRYSYWTRRKVVQIHPEWFYGNLRSMLTGRSSKGEPFQRFYETFKSQNLRFGGVYCALQPLFIPTDPQLIKDITVKDFEYFQNRGQYSHEKDVLTQNMFRMEGEPWRIIRQKLSPTFTSSCMKMMFHTVHDKVAVLENFLAQEIDGKEKKINISDLSARFTIDVIGSCIFGIECDSITDPDCEFKVKCRQIVKSRPLKLWLETNFPKKLLGYTGFRSFPDLEYFFRDVVYQTIDYREKHNVVKKDLMHLLLQLRNKGRVTDDETITSPDSDEKGFLTKEEILGQCFIFFAAGFDTSAATIAFALYELAKQPDIQEKVREEIRKMYDVKGAISYDDTKEMVLLDKVIWETLRKYPVLPVIPRVCSKRYKVSGSDVVLEKGTMVELPVLGFHMDPEYYPNPEKFDPERFTEEAKEKRPKYTYFPFGEGPRTCIGARFALMETKAGLIGFLRNNKFTCVNKAEMAFKASMILLHPNEDIWLNIEKV